MEERELKIEYVDIDSIKPSGRNAKQHPAEQIEQIKKSIREFGFNDPIAVWHDNEIVEGHGRLLAAMEMDEVQTIPVIRLDGLTDEQRRAYMLVHNKLTMNTDFDIDILNIELDNIVDIDMSEFGFDSKIEIEASDDEKQIALNESISVVIECENENEAEMIFNKLTEEGYTCRISTL